MMHLFKYPVATTKVTIRYPCNEFRIKAVFVLVVQLFIYFVSYLDSLKTYKTTLNCTM